MLAAARPARYRPSNLLLQWHLSDRCNLRCAHCYQEDYRRPPADLADWLGLIAQYLELLGDRPGHINLTGGEPFAVEELPALLDEFQRHRRRFGFGILSNGTLIDRPLAKRLRRWRPRFVQVSIDGGEQTHDRLRGDGSYRRAVEGLRALAAEGVPALIAFTAQRSNWREFAAVAELGRQVGARRVWADRLIPEGQGQREDVLSPDETRAFLELMHQCAGPRRLFARTRVAMERALQFLAADAPPYRCTAGDSLLTVMPDGQLYPCRRLPISVGNVYETPLIELYDREILHRLRAPRWEAAACRDCDYANVCHGGLRCLAYAVTGRLDTADPGCWLAAAAASAATTSATAASAATAAIPSTTIPASALRPRVQPLDEGEAPGR